MDTTAITAHARLAGWEAQTLVRTWFNELGLELAYAEGDLLIAWLETGLTVHEGGFTTPPNLVVEAQILALREGVQLRWSLHHGGGWLVTRLAAETLRGIQRRLVADGRWGLDKPGLPEHKEAAVPLE